MFASFRLASLALSLIFYTHANHAQEEISIAVGEWPPYLSPDQKHNGVAAHLISDIFSAMDIKANIRFYPWTRAYNEARDGLHAASAIWMDKEARRLDFIYSDAVLVEQFVFFHHKEFDFNWDSVNDLKDLAIGGVYASSYGPILDQALSRGAIKMERVNRPEQNFNKILKNRIALFPFEIHVGKHVLKKYFSTSQQQQIVHHPKPYLNNSSFVLFPKSIASSKKLSEAFNQQLNIMKKNGQYDTYFKKFKQGYYEK